MANIYSQRQREWNMRGNIRRAKRRMRLNGSRCDVTFFHYVGNDRVSQFPIQSSYCPWLTYDRLRFFFSRPLWLRTLTCLLLVFTIFFKWTVIRNGPFHPFVTEVLWNALFPWNRTLWCDIMQFISGRGTHVIFRWGLLVPGTYLILALVWPIRFK